MHHVKIAVINIRCPLLMLSEDEKSGVMDNWNQGISDFLIEALLRQIQMLNGPQK